MKSIFRQNKQTDRERKRENVEIQRVRGTDRERRGAFRKREVQKERVRGTDRQRRGTDKEREGGPDRERRGTDREMYRQ